MAVTNDGILVECQDQEESFIPCLILITLSLNEGVRSWFGVFVFRLLLGLLFVWSPLWLIKKRKSSEYELLESGSWPVDLHAPF